ncbi:aldehyde dehydrogenase [Metarhizobium album]|uniref:Aldehyde dehydrogenase n=1 Tax=Metarhizobium album TaxID=2182425 RepID=A0A2U2DJE2_9HYPH|nr:aldehyde dehydrogenase family protein [Rhizobium album]PWE53429.1 aldehyde dehydrogenase [Rhizobium album]
MNAIPLNLPTRRGLYYGGEWHAPKTNRYLQSKSPSTGELLGEIADGTSDDAEAVIAAAQQGFRTWRDVPPLERAKILREAGALIRKHGDELALIDSADGGNPFHEMRSDAAKAAGQFDFFAGLVTEMKGDSIPMGPGVVNFTTREPLGVVARIVAFNHPFMFTAAKAAAPLAAGNSVIMKPPEVASLSAIRLAEIIGHLFPAGVFNVAIGGREMGAALSTHPDIAMVTLIGSVPTGRAIMKAASETLKPLLFELGGKNALIAFPDADPDEVASAVIGGMNFTWCGQSCGSTSRAFIHESIYAAVVEKLPKHVAKYRPGLPTDPATTMGAIVSREQYEKVLRYIDVAKADGAKLLLGGKRPDDPKLAEGNFVEPTVFVDVNQTMRIANEEVFGPILSVLPWSDEKQMLRDVNAVEYGLTCSIWTNDLKAAHRAAAGVEAGFVWVNEVAKHFLGTPFGGYKQSGIGREECLSELLAFTREKNIHVRFAG